MSMWAQGAAPRKAVDTFVWWLFLAAVILQIFGAGVSNASDAVCAEVKIVIEQKLSLERQAFDAHMLITNGLPDQKLEGVNIALRFLDANNSPVVATTDPNANGAKFFYRIDRLEGIGTLSGATINEKSTADIHWLIIPSQGAGGNSPHGSLYYIGATVTYTLGGKTETVEISPDYILVRPQPLLELDYFLPNDVYGDDAFTPETEPSVPFTLGLRVKNVGAGISYKTRIDTAQPKIVENDLGLLVGFEILNGYVAEQQVGKSLLLDFDDIQPGGVAVGRWNMLTTLSGRFVDFSASFSHADDLGGAVTLLVKSVRTHTLVRDVRVDVPGRDMLRDFLARDGSTPRVYESDGIDSQVSDQSAMATLTFGLNQTIEINFPPVTNLFSYVRVSDPYRGHRSVSNVIRSDGYIVPKENVWLSKERDEHLVWHYYINLFDYSSTGQYTMGLSASDKAELYGHVYFDSNGNGLEEIGEQPIPLIEVYMEGTEEFSGESVIAKGFTDSKGDFKFVDLKPGEYSVSVAGKSGMVDGISLPGNAGGVGGNGSISSIPLGAGDHAYGYVFSKRTSTAIDPDAQADLTVSLETPSASIGPDGVATVHVMAKNIGPSEVTDSVIVMDIPAGLMVKSHHVDVGNYAAGRWDMGFMGKGASAVLILELEVDKSTKVQEWSLLSRIGSTKGDPEPGNNSARLNLRQDKNKGFFAEQTIRQGVRALVLLGCDNKPGCVTEKMSNAEAFFDEVGVVAKFVTTEKEYRRALRTGVYSLIWLNADVSFLSSSLIEETRASVLRGNSLVLDGGRNTSSPGMLKLWDGGYSSNALSGQIELMISGARVAVKGDAWALESPTANTLVHYSSGTSAIVAQVFGHGQVLVAGFDVWDANVKSPDLARLLREEIEGRLNPVLTNPMLSSGLVELMTRIENNTSEVRDTQLKTEFDKGVVLIKASPSPSASNPAYSVWLDKHAAGQTSRVVQQLRLPQVAQDVKINSALTDVDNQQIENEWSFPVRTVDAHALEENVYTSLKAIEGQYPALMSVLTKIRSHTDRAVKAVSAGVLDSGIDNLLEAFKGCDEVTVPSARDNLMNSLAQWLGLVSEKWAEQGLPSQHIHYLSGSGQKSPVERDFSQMLRVKVVDEYGKPVSGVVVEFSLPSTGPTASFDLGGKKAQVVTDFNGVASSPTLRSNSQVGDFTAYAGLQNGLNAIAFTLSNVQAGTRLYSLQAVSGQGQNAVAGTRFLQALIAVVRDEQGKPVHGQKVVFEVRKNVASATFAGGLDRAVVTTNAQGMAVSPDLTASDEIGEFRVVAKCDNAFQDAEFILTNIPVNSPVLTIEVLSGDAQMAVTNTKFGQALRAIVKDKTGKVVSNYPAIFRVPLSGASASFAGNMTEIEILTDSNGVAASPLLTANGVAGDYIVTVSAIGALTSAEFKLSNKENNVSDREFIVKTPTGTGAMKATVYGGGPGCAFNKNKTQVRRPDNFLPLFGVLAFPHGIFDFELIGCDQGSTVQVVTEWPSLINVTGYLKYGKTLGIRTREHWYVPDDMVISGNSITYSITDGGNGDDDLERNGIIRDPGGPVIQTGPIPSPIPVGSGLGILVVLLLIVWIAWLFRRRAVVSLNAQHPLIE